MEDLNKMIEEMMKTYNEEFNISDEVLNKEIDSLVDKYDFTTGEVVESIKFINKSDNPDPEFAKKGDSGFDLRANIEESITLKPLERKLIPTGLYFELPPNTELQVRPRSGIALKHGISVLNTPGTVDEGYRGEVGIIAVNLSNEEYTIQHGERIAQGVIMNVVGQRKCKLIKTEELSETERGEGGFGSTGKE
jgi:dUTP pyrophosphatase